MEIPFHPILFGVFPVLSLLALNISQISSGDYVRALVLSLIVSLVLFGSLRLAIKDWTKAALLTSTLLILFYSYGHLYQTLGEVEFIGVEIRRHRYLAPLYTALALVLAIWIMGFSRQTSPTRFLNLIGLLLVSFSAARLVAFQIGHPPVTAQPIAARASLFPANVAQDPDLPDVYYIVLDGYSRDDMIEDYYDYDNRPFLNALTERGFYIAECSQSNYARTFSSLSASLNMRYMSESTRQDLIANAENYIDVHSQNKEVIIKNEVRRFFEEFGYQTIAFQTGFPHTEWRNADIYFSRELGNIEIARMETNINGFEQMLLEITPGLILLDANTILNESFIAAIPDSGPHRRYLILNNTFDALETVPSIPGRKFVFAHIASPHIPFVFGRDGEFVPELTDPTPNYGLQLDTLNNRILRIVDRILLESPSPPIIIIQGDHGGDFLEVDARRMPILNAYYFPGEAKQTLYATITPINTFRLLFNEYFDANFKMMQDISYFSPPFEHLEYEMVEDPNPGCSK